MLFFNFFLLIMDDGKFFGILFILVICVNFMYNKIVYLMVVNFNSFVVLLKYFIMFLVIFLWLNICLRLIVCFFFDDF